MKKLSIIALVASVMVMSACGPEDPGLKDAYKNYFKIGVAVTPRNVTDSLQKAVILKEFNSITAENCMKPGEIHPQPGVWNFQQADAIANFCRENGIKMRGHCLVWHSQFANWMFNKYDEAIQFGLSSPLVAASAASVVSAASVALAVPVLRVLLRVLPRQVSVLRASVPRASVPRVRVSVLRLLLLR